jgi:Stringent starvation protein B
LDASHQHPPEAACPPTCPAWSDGALQLFAVQRRYAEMLEACRSAEAVESVVVAPNVPGVSVPDYLAEEDLVRLNLVVGRDTPELLMDEWGLHCNLTFRGRRNECAIPWAAVRAGKLRPPPRKRPRFAVIEGGKKE